MSQHNTEKHKSDIVFALADYKQLVISYKTKYAQIVAAVSFWRTTVIWLSVCIVALSWVIALEIFWHKKDLAQIRDELSQAKDRLASVSMQYELSKLELVQARAALLNKESIIIQLEKNISTASKEFLEGILQEK
jgi:hypothetical protein